MEKFDIITFQKLQEVSVLTSIPLIHSVPALTSMPLIQSVQVLESIPTIQSTKIFDKLPDLLSESIPRIKSTEVFDKLPDFLSEHHGSTVFDEIPDVISRIQLESKIEATTPNPTQPKSSHLMSNQLPVLNVLPDAFDADETIEPIQVDRLYCDSTQFSLTIEELRKIRDEIALIPNSNHYKLIREYNFNRVIRKLQKKFLQKNHGCKRLMVERTRKFYYHVEEARLKSNISKSYASEACNVTRGRYGRIMSELGIEVKKRESFHQKEVVSWVQQFTIPRKDTYAICARTGQRRGLLNMTVYRRFQNPVTKNNLCFEYIIIRQRFCDTVKNLFKLSTKEEGPQVKSIAPTASFYV